MHLSFLKRILSGYSIEQNGQLFFFRRGEEEPVFCLLPFWIFPKKMQELIDLQKSHQNLVYLRPSYRWDPFSKTLLLRLQTLYFLTPKKDKYPLFYDRRYLKTVSGYYLLPPISIKLSICLKNTGLQSLEEELFLPSRKNVPFYLEGDTTDKLQNSKYLERLQKRQILEKKSPLSIYKFLKKILDS